MWFQYALIGALITGAGQVLVKKGQITLTPLLDNLLAAIIVNAILVPFLFFHGISFAAGIAIIPYALVAAIMYATFYYVISFGKVSLMISLINTFPLVTIGLAIIFLHEYPGIYQWLGILLVLVGVYFIGRGKQVERIKMKNKLWIFWGLVGSCAIGLAEFLTKLATKHVDGFTFTFFVYLMYFPPLILFCILDKKGRKFKLLKNKLTLIYTIAGIFFIESGLIAIALAYQHGPATLVSPTVATHTLITAALAMIFLKEKLSASQKTGIVINLLGVSIIGIYS